MKYLPIKIIKLTKLFSLGILCLSLWHCQFGWQNRTIQQSNVITEEQISQLRPGMSKEEVAVIMGTPVLVNTFDADRWNYIYSVHKGSRILERKKVIIHFANERISKIEK